MQPRRGQQLVQSLERGLAALEMALDGSVRPSEVAEALGIDRSTAYRLLYTLMAKGYLLQDERTREFTSNPAKFSNFTARWRRCWTGRTLRGTF